MFERGITVSYETIRVWCSKFGAECLKRSKKCRGPVGDAWHLDEVYLKIDGHNQYLWRAVDQIAIPYDCGYAWWACIRELGFGGFSDACCAVDVLCRVFTDNGAVLMCWARGCWRYCRATSAMRTSRRFEATRSVLSCWA